jgi:dTDP-4-amino-4,6-dideoxygalactose transaminase
MSGEANAMIPLQRPKFGAEELDRIAGVLESGWATMGPVSCEFERLIAERHQVPHALVTTSCTAALHLSLLALGLGPGDEVVVPAFTWVTSAYCAEYVGARPVFADVDIDTFNLDVSAFEAAITQRTRAVIAVHLFGQAADLDAIARVARPRGIAIVEDAACGIGTTYKGTPVGGLGDLGAFSFHPRKVITTGEGGAVTTNDDHHAATVTSLRNHGASHPVGQPAPVRPYDMNTFDRVGYNLRMSDLQAAVGVVQMARLDRLLAERRDNAAAYDRALEQVADVIRPSSPPELGHTFQSYVIRVREGGYARRNRVMDAMARFGVQTRPGTHAVHRLGYFRAAYGIPADAYPNACAAEDTSITLPLFPDMTDADRDRVVDALLRGLAA